MIGMGLISQITMDQFNAEWAAQQQQTWTALGEKVVADNQTSEENTQTLGTALQNFETALLHGVAARAGRGQMRTRQFWQRTRRTKFSSNSRHATTTLPATCNARPPSIDAWT